MIKSESLNWIQFGLFLVKSSSSFYCQLTHEYVELFQDEVTLQFCATKLDKKDFFGKSDPFMTFSRVNENGT